MGRSLRKMPPVEFFAAGYFKYEPPSDTTSEPVEALEPLPLYE